MPIVIREIKKKKKGNMGEEKVSPKKNMGMDSMMPGKKKTKPKKVDTMKYMYGGGKLKMAKGYSAGGKIFTGR